MILYWVAWGWWFFFFFPLWNSFHHANSSFASRGQYLSITWVDILSHLSWSLSWIFQFDICSFRWRKNWQIKMYKWWKAPNLHSLSDVMAYLIHRSYTAFSVQTLTFWGLFYLHKLFILFIYWIYISSFPSKANVYIDIAYSSTGGRIRHHCRKVNETSERIVLLFLW